MDRTLVSTYCFPKDTTTINTHSRANPNRCWRLTCFKAEFDFNRSILLIIPSKALPSLVSAISRPTVEAAEEVAAELDVDVEAGEEAD